MPRNLWILPLSFLLLTGVKKADAEPVTKKPVRTITLKNPQPYRIRATTLRFSPDGKTLMAGGENCPLQFFDVSTGQAKAGLGRQFRGTYAAEYSPDGSKLALGCSERVGVTLWDTKTGKLIRTFNRAYPGSEGGQIYSLAYSKDGARIFAVKEGEIQVWNAGTAQLMKSFRPVKGIHSVVLSPDGKTLACGYAVGADCCEKSSLLFVDAETGKVKKRWATSGWLIGYAPNGKVLLSRSQGKQFPDRLQMTYLDTGECWTRLECKITADGDAQPVDYSPNKKLLAVGHDSGKVSIYDPRDIKKRSYMPKVEEFSSGKELVSDLKFSPDGRILATATNKGVVQLRVVGK